MPRVQRSSNDGQESIYALVSLTTPEWGASQEPVVNLSSWHMKPTTRWKKKKRKVGWGRTWAFLPKRRRLTEAQCVGWALLTGDTSSLSVSLAAKEMNKSADPFVCRVLSGDGGGDGGEWRSHNTLRALLHHGKLRVDTLPSSRQTNSWEEIKCVVLFCLFFPPHPNPVEVFLFFSFFFEGAVGAVFFFLFSEKKAVQPSQWEQFKAKWHNMNNMLQMWQRGLSKKDTSTVHLTLNMNYNTRPAWITSPLAK